MPVDPYDVARGLSATAMAALREARVVLNKTYTESLHRQGTHYDLQHSASYALPVTTDHRLIPPLQTLLFRLWNSDTHSCSTYQHHTAPNTMSEFILPLDSPLHRTIRQHHRNSPIQDLSSRPSESVENRGLVRPSKWLGAIVGDAVCYDSFLMKRTRIAPDAFD